MKKRIIAMSLALILCVSLLAACANGGTTTPPSPIPPIPGETTPTGEPIRVGWLGPLTGPVAEFGIAVREGVLLYVEQYNAAGGLNGRPIQLIEFDDEHNSMVALTGYNWLVDQGVTAIIGGVTSGPTRAVVPEGFADNMPMITASATHVGVTRNMDTGEVYTNMFRSCFIDPFQGERMAYFAFNEYGARTAAVIYNIGIDYSIGLADAFIEKAGAIGL